MGFYVGLAYALKRTIWLSAGFGIAFGTLGLIFGSIWSAKIGDRNGIKGEELAIATATMIASSHFAGVFGGWLLQEHWYYANLETYENVDPLNWHDVPGDGRYVFTADTKIDQDWAGSHYWEVQTDNGKDEFLLCGAPLTSGLGIVHADTPVAFWVVAKDCCGGATRWGRSGCFVSEGWDTPKLYGVSQRNELGDEQYVVPYEIRNWYTQPAYLRDRNGSSFVPTQVRWIEWTTPAAVDKLISSRLLGARITILLHAFLWPLWIIPLAILVGAGAILRCVRCR
jgi:hypothetical protein